MQSAAAELVQACVGGSAQQQSHSMPYATSYLCRTPKCALPCCKAAQQPRKVHTSHVNAFQVVLAQVTAALHANQTCVVASFVTRGMRRSHDFRAPQC
jgi:hypothetical protein